MSHLFANYQRQPLDILSGKGSQVQDEKGNHYLDFTSGIGVASLGYLHAEVTKEVEKQLNKIWHVPNLYESSLQEQVADLLDPSQDYLAFFCNSGAEANEAAIKLARKATGKSKIITFIDSFHGRTYGSMSATGQDKIKKGFEPLVPDFVHVPFNDVKALERVLDHQTAAVMTELIQGESGVTPAQQDWIQKVAELCKEKGSLLIVDEVQTGIGRTGTMFCYEQYDIKPDIITLAKGLGNGLPVGAMLGKVGLRHAFGPGSHGSTFGGNKLAMASATAVLEEISQPEFLEQIVLKGKRLEALLTKELLSLQNVVEVRGKGLMWGIEMANPIHSVLEKAKESSLLVLQAGQNTIRLLPSLIVTFDEIETAVSILKTCIILVNEETMCEGEV